MWEHARFRASQNRDDVGLHVLPTAVSRGAKFAFPVDALQPPLPPRRKRHPPPRPSPGPPHPLYRDPAEWKQPRGIQ